MKKWFLTSLFAVVLGFSLVLGISAVGVATSSQLSVQEYEVVNLSHIQILYSPMSNSGYDAYTPLFGTMIEDVISTTVDTIKGLLAGIGQGIVQYFEQTFLITDTSGVATDALNPVGTMIFVFLGISAAFGVAAMIFNMIRRRG